MLPNRYKINTTEYDDVHPEETLADGLSAHSSVEVPVSRAVFGTLYTIIGLCLVLILFQAMRLQIVHGGQYAAQADRSRFNRYPVAGLRGAIVDTHGVPLVENIPAFDVVLARSEFNTVNLDRLSSILGGPVTIGNQGVITLRKDAPKSVAISVQAAQIPGVYIVPTAKRHYIEGSAAAHIIGYTSEGLQGERIGREGVEAYYDSYLRVPPEYVALIPNMSITTSDADNISTARLTIDSAVQQALYDAVTSVFREHGVHRGAAIVQRVTTGEILGMVSIPSFNSNNIDAKILTDSNRPLFNRAVSGLYAPGSTIKPLYALAGLKEHIVTPSTLVYANGSIEVPSEVDPSKTYIFRDWKVHGWTDIRKAIAWSVDVYYYALGGGYGDISGLGVDRIEKYLRLFGVDKKTDVDLPAEAAGFVPSKQWKKDTRGEPWYLGDTYNISIGQGDLQVTPIWLSAYVSSIANGGRMMKPFIVSSISKNGKNIYANEPEVMLDLPFDAATVRVVQEGMRQTVIDGTATMLQDLPQAVAAKTGTAQVTGKNLNSLLVVYGPYDKPDISVTVLIEQIKDSQLLGVQVAHRFLMWYFQQ